MFYVFKYHAFNIICMYVHVHGARCSDVWCMVASSSPVGGSGTLHKDFKVYSFKLTFECTNNVAKYESLLSGLNALKELKVNRIYVYGDS